MYALATTSCSVLRGTTTNAFGDVLDSGAAYLSGIPAALYETAETVFDPGTETPRVIRSVTAHLPAGTDVTERDQLRDDRAGVPDAVLSVSTRAQPGRTADLDLLLRRIT